MPKNNHFRVNLSNIIKRLPLQSYIDVSQAALIDFSPAWIDWCNKSLPGEFHQIVTLNSFNRGTLSIRCTTSVAASQLKHMQVSILECFHAAGHSQIKRLKIEIDHFSNQASDNSSAVSLTEYTATKTETRAPLNNEAIVSLERCQKGIKNEKLSGSLKKLHKTLESLKGKA